MNRPTSRLAIAALALAASAGVVTLTAAPATAAAPASAISAAPSAAAACDIFEVTETAYVRENPSDNSVVRKTKQAGDRVTNCWGAHAGPIGGDDWTAVACDCATDGQGWIISRKLRWIGVG